MKRFLLTLMAGVFFAASVTSAAGAPQGPFHGKADMSGHSHCGSQLGSLGGKNLPGSPTPLTTNYNAPLENVRGEYVQDVESLKGAVAWARDQGLILSKAIPHALETNSPHALALIKAARFPKEAAKQLNSSSFSFILRRQKVPEEMLSLAVRRGASEAVLAELLRAGCDMKNLERYPVFKKPHLLAELLNSGAATMNDEGTEIHLGKDILDGKSYWDGLLRNGWEPKMIVLSRLFQQPQLEPALRQLALRTAATANTTSGYSIKFLGRLALSGPREVLKDTMLVAGVFDYVPSFGSASVQRAVEDRDFELLDYIAEITGDLMQTSRDPQEMFEKAISSFDVEMVEYLDKQYKPHFLQDRDLQTIFYSNILDLEAGALVLRTVQQPDANTPKARRILDLIERRIRSPYEDIDGEKPSTQVGGTP